MKKQFKYIPIKTDTGDYMIYLDWSINAKLTLAVWDDIEAGADESVLFDEEIDL